MVAGEYAVLEKNHTLVAMAVDRFVYATITEQADQVLDLENLDMYSVPWTFIDGTVTFAQGSKRLRFVHQAMEVTFRYLVEQDIPIRSFSLAVRSELDDTSGVKYGLGSSAAVTTAVVAAILEAHLGKTPERELLFRLSAIAHVRTQGNGSGADIAASVYGGMIEYTSFQADWLLASDAQASSLTELVHVDWPYASIAPIAVPDRIHMYVGWTGSPASTVRLVDQLLLLKETNNHIFNAFLTKSEQAVQLFLQGLKENDVSRIFQGIQSNHDILAQVGVDASVPVETPLLGSLSAIARDVGGAGKLSGAGGGDCGIAFLTGEHQKEKLFQKWQQANITPLHIHMTTEGAHRIYEQ